MLCVADRNSLLDLFLVLLAWPLFCSQYCCDSSVRRDRKAFQDYSCFFLNVILRYSFGVSKYAVLSSYYSHPARNMHCKKIHCHNFLQTTSNRQLSYTTTSPNKFWLTIIFFKEENMPTPLRVTYYYSKISFRE